MDTGEPIIRAGTRDAKESAAPSATILTGNQAHRTVTAFSRHELSEILNVYGRHVAAGIWRDYAIDHLRDEAIFSIFRRASEMPLYRIIKQPKLARKQGAYSILTPTGLILKRGHELRTVLRAIDKPLKVVG